MKIADLAMEVRPGPGVVSRWGRVALVLCSEPMSEEAATLLGIVRGLASHPEPGRVAAHEFAGALTAMDLGRIPPFCLVADADRGLAVVLHGPVLLRASGPETELTLSGEDKPTWVDEYLTGELDRLEVHPDGFEAGEPEPSFDLVAGTVPGVAASFAPRRGDEPAVRVVGDEAAARSAEDDEVGIEESPVATPPPERAEGGEQVAAEAPAFAVVDLTEGDADERQPLPLADEAGAGSGSRRVGTYPLADLEAPDEEDLVDGIRCARDHFNHPEALFCAHCGVSMVQVTRDLVRDHRPPLGILVFDDGATFALDLPYVIGRHPEENPTVQGAPARPLLLDDPDRTLSRSHAEIRLTGWDAEIVDRASTNGTFLQPPDGPWQQLESRTPVVLAPGANVRVGGHRFVFESHHKAKHR